MSDRWMGYEEINLEHQKTGLFWMRRNGVGIEVCRITAYSKGFEVTATDGSNGWAGEKESGFSECRFCALDPDRAKSAPYGEVVDLTVIGGLEYGDQLLIDFDAMTVQKSPILDYGNVMSADRYSDGDTLRFLNTIDEP